MAVMYLVVLDDALGESGHFDVVRVRAESRDEAVAKAIHPDNGYGKTKAFVVDLVDCTFYTLEKRFAASRGMNPVWPGVEL